MTTPNLALPFIQASQAQKHVTHNEALRRLDGIVQLSVISRTVATPPISPLDGQRWIVPAGATGAWTGWAGSIAFRLDGAWTRLEPRPGWLAWVESENQPFAWNGSAWVLAGAGTFLSLTDTPDAYSGQALRGVRVNAAATALEFFDLGGGGGGGGAAFFVPPILVSFSSSPNNVGVLPAGLVAGNLMLALVSGGNLATSFTPPAGWTLVPGSTANFAFANTQAFWKVATASETAPTFVPIGGNADGACVSILQIADFDTLSPFGQVATAGSAVNSTNVVYPSISATTNALLVGVSTAGWGGNWTRTVPAGYTEHLDYSSTRLNSGGSTQQVITRPVSAAGTFGGNATLSGSLNIATVQMAINPRPLQALAGSVVQVSRSPLGFWTGMETREQVLTGLTGASVDTTIVIPDRSICLGVSTVVQTAITGATSFGCGIAGQATKFGGLLGIAAGSSNRGVIGPEAFYADTPVRLTANGGNFTGGAVRLAIHLLTVGVS